MMCGKPPHHNALQCTYKEMRNKDTIPHLKKCFSYAIDQNKGTSAQLTKTLRSIPDHLYNHRENCGEWCQRKNGVGLQKVILHDKHLYNNLHNIFNKYANNAPKFSVVTSSQGNESLNNIMAHKAPKNNCYSLSESADFRLASAVASKNDGDSYLMKVKKILSLSPGKDTESYVRSQDSIRKKRAVKAKLAIFKKRRNMLAIKRKALRTKNATFEGIQYQSNCGMETDSGFVPTSSNLISFNNVTLCVDECCIVYFDLETSGFQKNANILQIAAQSEGKTFDVYVTPTQPVDAAASKITGLQNIRGRLFVHDKEVNTLSIMEALVSFSQFLSSISTQ
ncbi:hypothetical protein PV325_009432 [Microctonus aethiopoides]|nr:hypothetical protein PV325_009432 [Microctonus aethiopoides]